MGDPLTTEVWTLLTTLNDTDTSVGDGDSNDNVRVADTVTRPLYIAISLLGMISNAFTVFVILSSKQMRQKLTNVFILHQSIVDFVVAFFLLMTLVTTVRSYDNLQGIQGELICRLWLTSMPLWSSVLTSTYNLVALTVERYLEICHPIWHKVSFTYNKAAIVIVTVWLLGLLHQLPTHLPTAGVVDGKCFVLAFWASKAANKVFGVFNFLVRYLIPLLIMMVAYTAMIRVLRSQGLTVHDGGTNAKPTKHQERMARARTNIFKTLLIVTLAFIVCWTLNQLLFLMFTFGFALDFSTWWYNLSVVLVNANCCINPFIYAAKYEAFQKSVKALFCRGRTTVHPLDGSTVDNTQSTAVSQQPTQQAKNNAGHM